MYLLDTGYDTYCYLIRFSRVPAGSSGHPPKRVGLVHFNFSMSTEFRLFILFLLSTLFRLLTLAFCWENIFQLADDVILTQSTG